jgi:hypothetical protein
MIERRADWKRAEQSTARFFPTRSPSAARLSAVRHARHLGISSVASRTRGLNFTWLPQVPNHKRVVELPLRMQRERYSAPAHRSAYYNRL